MNPDLFSIVWVIVFVLVLSVILDRLIFRPVLKVIKQREDAVTSARQRIPSLMHDRAFAVTTLATERTTEVTQ